MAQRPERYAHGLTVTLRAATGAPDATRHGEATTGHGVERIGVPRAHDGAGRDASLEQGPPEMRADTVVDAQSLAGVHDEDLPRPDACGVMTTHGRDWNLVQGRLARFVHLDETVLS